MSASPKSHENVKQLTSRTDIQKTSVHSSLIRPKLDYGSTFYSIASNRIFETFDPIQNSYIRLTLRTFPTTPIPRLYFSLQVLSHKPTTAECLQTIIQSMQS